MKSLFKKGFTLVEMLVVLAIIAILLLIATPQFNKFRQAEVLNAASRDVLSSLEKARSNTLSSVNSSEYGVHFQSDQVIIFKGLTYSVGAVTNESISISEPASITNVTLGGVSGSTGNVYFNRLYGAPSTTGTVTISTSSLSKTITISATGAASMN
jgi:prepilin-type N-terminal cleavage/methylation domain-containing protein